MKLLLDGLCCPNCAAKIEREAGRLKNVRACSVNFANTTMVIETDSADYGRIMDSVAKLVNEIEPGVSVISMDGEGHGDEGHGHSNGQGGSERKRLAFCFGAGLLLLLTASYAPEGAYRLGLYIAAYLAAGYDVLWRSLKNIRRGRVFDENFLMTVATIGAFVIGDYPEAVAVMLFYKAGEFFQELAVSRSRRSIAELMDIRPDYAVLDDEDGERRVEPESVLPGSTIIVRPGEKVPLDGIVAEGASALDTSALTGESAPRDVSAGDEVLSGSINKSGVLRICVTRPYGESAVSKILRLVEEAGSKKAPTENFISRFAAIYTPVVVALAVALAVLPPLFLGFEYFTDYLYRALMFLVISCPCALVISIPLGFFGGIGGAARRGILAKGGNYLEALGAVDTVVFDKTGTLTKGVFEVTEIVPQEGFSEEELLYYAAMAESFSAHPIARSITGSYAGELDKGLIRDYTETAGRGISAEIAGRRVLAGNVTLLREEGVENSTHNRGGTVVHVAVDGQYAGCVYVADTLKDDAAEGIRQLKALGVRKTVMLTGDNRESALTAAEAAGVDECYYELLPQDKVEMLDKLLMEKPPKSKLAFVGDGINDAPVLARADIGVAMGGVGSDAAVEAADVVIMNDEPSKLATAIRIARKTRRVVSQNIALAIVVKLAVMLLGAFGMATMWAAVIADVGVAMLAVLNAMRAMNTKNL